MDSILISIKKMLGIAEEYEHFDVDLIIHINSVLSILTQIGVGPSEGFSITDKAAIWYDFVTGDQYNDVRSYVYMKVKLMFDPPTSSSVMDSMNRMISEIEWRLFVKADTDNKEENQNGN